MRKRLFAKCVTRNSWSNKCFWRKPNFSDDLENNESMSELEDEIYNNNEAKECEHIDCKDPTIIRLEGGSAQREIFYDCLSNEAENHNLLRSELQVFEVINQIKDPKEFKGLLKHMAFTAHVLYHSFRQAYSNAKKVKKAKKPECPKCAKDTEKLTEKLQLRNKNFHEMTANRGDNLEKKKDWGKLNRSVGVGMENKNVENKCPMCLRYLVNESKPENDVKTIKVETAPYSLRETNLCQDYEKDLQHLDYCDRCAVLRGEMPWPTKALNEPKAYQQAGDSKLFSTTEANKKQDSKLFSTTEPNKKQVLNLNPVCVTIPLKLQVDGQDCQKRVLETEIYVQNFADQFQHLSSASIKKPQFNQKTEYSNLGQLIKQPYYDFSSQFKEEPYPPLQFAPKTTEVHTKKPVNLLSGSDIFHSCNSISSTSIKKPSVESPQQQTLFDEKSLKEIMDLLNKHFQNLNKTTTSPPLPMPLPPSPLPLPLPPKLPLPLPPPLPPFTKNEIKTELQSRGIQSSLGLYAGSKKPESRTYFTQTAAPTTTTRPPPSTMSATIQYDPRIKADKMRRELFAEVAAALERTTTKEALKSLLEGKRFSLPTNLQTDKKAYPTPARYSFPADHYKAIPTSAAPLHPLPPLPITTFAPTKPQITKKPEIPPKPVSTPAMCPAFKPPPTSQEVSSKPDLSPKLNLLTELPPPPPEILLQDLQRDIPSSSQGTKISKMVSETMQTDVSGVKPSGHYKRNELRLDIQEEMKELLQPKSVKYKANERDEILQAFNKLLHPEKSASSNQKINRENALQDIHYIVESDSLRFQNLKPSESQATIIENILYMINPKNTRKNAKRKKYNKEAKEKILEDLHLLLKPRKGKQAENREMRNYILHDLRYMLDTGQETLSPQRPPRSPDIGPESSRAQEIRQERLQKSPNEIRDSVLADLVHILDSPGNSKQASNARSVAEQLPASSQRIETTATKPTNNKSRSSGSSNESSYKSFT